MSTKKYAGLDTISYFYNKLLTIFALKEHTHTKSEITDMQEFKVSDDNDGNVTFDYN